MQNQGFDVSSSTKVYILQDEGIKWPKKHGFEYTDVRFESWLRENQYQNWLSLFFFQKNEVKFNELNSLLNSIRENGFDLSDNIKRKFLET